MVGSNKVKSGYFYKVYLPWLIYNHCTLCNNRLVGKLFRKLKNGLIYQPKVDF